MLRVHSLEELLEFGDKKKCLGSRNIWRQKNICDLRWCLWCAAVDCDMDTCEFVARFTYLDTRFIGSIGPFTMLQHVLRCVSVAQSKWPTRTLRLVHWCVNWWRGENALCCSASCHCSVVCCLPAACLLYLESMFVVDSLHFLRDFNHCFTSQVTVFGLKQVNHSFEIGTHLSNLITYCSCRSSTCEKWRARTIFFWVSFCLIVHTVTIGLVCFPPCIVLFAACFLWREFKWFLYKGAWKTCTSSIFTHLPVSMSD